MSRKTGSFRGLKRRAGAWYEIMRPFAFTASIVPICAGGAVAWANGQFSLWLFLLALVGGTAIQAGANVINEIYDVRQGIDKITSPRASHALLKGALGEREAFGLAAALFLMAAGAGIVFLRLRGWPMLALGATALLAGYSYTGPPFQYKFHALGVPLVFLLMGPLEVVSTYYAVTGGFDIAALVASIPIGCLVAAILHGNEWRDISEDSRADITTLSEKLGARGAHYLYVALVTGSYLATGLAIMGHLLPTSSLLVLLSLPIFVSLVHDSELGASGQVRALAMIDLKTARFHMVFGLLLAAGLFLSPYIG